MSTKNKYFLEVWIGLAKVKANRENTYLNAAHGYVNVLGLSNNKHDFRRNVSFALQNNGLMLIRLQDAEPFDKRIREYNINKSLREIAKSIIKKTIIIEFGTFHTYD